MLVLSRKMGEKIVISDDITLEVVAIEGNKVRLGIVAPRSYVIRRPESKKGPKGKKERRQA